MFSYSIPIISNMIIIGVGEVKTVSAEEAQVPTTTKSIPWLLCSIPYSMLQCYIASIRCYSTI